MTRRPPKDPYLAFVYHLAYEAGQRQFRLEHPELNHLFEDKTALPGNKKRERARSTRAAEVERDR